MTKQQIMLIDYLLGIGEPLHRTGSKTYSHDQHDSLVVDLKKNYFYWNSRSVGGTSGITYLIAMYGFSYEAAKSKYIDDVKRLGLDDGKHFSKPFKYPQKFNYTIKSQPSRRHALKYLVVTRGITNKIVNQAKNAGLIDEDTNQNIIFKWLKHGKVIGYNKQGTTLLTVKEKKKFHTKRPYLKRTQPTTKEGTYWGFNWLVGQPKNIYFFESEIDLLSYKCLFENSLNDYWLISLTGLSLEKIKYFVIDAQEKLKEERIMSLHCCFDNDKAGDTAYRTLSNIGVKSGDKTIPFIDDRPARIEGIKDWNDFLIKRRHYNA